MICRLPVGIWIRLSEFLLWLQRTQLIGKLKRADDVRIVYHDPSDSLGPPDQTYYFRVQRHGVPGGPHLHEFWGLEVPLSATARGGFRPYYAPRAVGTGLLMPIWTTDELTIFDYNPWTKMRKNPDAPKTASCEPPIYMINALAELCAWEARTKTIATRISTALGASLTLRWNDLADIEYDSAGWWGRLWMSDPNLSHLVDVGLNAGKSVPPNGTLVYAARNGWKFWVHSNHATLGHAPPRVTSTSLKASRRDQFLRDLADEIRGARADDPDLDVGDYVRSLGGDLDDLERDVQDAGWADLEEFFDQPDAWP